LIFPEATQFDFSLISPNKRLHQAEQDITQQLILINLTGDWRVYHRSVASTHQTDSIILK